MYKNIIYTFYPYHDAKNIQKDIISVDIETNKYYTMYVHQRTDCFLLYDSIFDCPDNVYLHSVRTKKYECGVYKTYSELIENI